MKILKKQWIGIILAVIILVAVALGIVYTKTDVFKSPRDLFYKYLVGNVDTFGSWNYDQIVEEVKRNEEKKSITTGNIKIKIDGDDLNDTEKEVYDTIGNVKVNYESKNIPQEKKAMGNVTVQYKEQDFLKMDWTQNQELYGIKVEELFDKYITIENRELKKLVEKFGIDPDDVPDEISTTSMYDLLYVSETDRKNIINTYKQILDEQLKEEKFKKEKQVEVEWNGNKVKTNAYKLSLTNEEVKTLVIKLLEKLKTDDLTLGLIADKANKMNLNQTLNDNEKITTENLADEIEYLISDIEEDEIEENLDIIVYEYKGKTIKTDIKFGEESIKIDNISAQDQAKVTINMENEPDEEQAEIVIDTKKENDKTNVNVTLNVTEYDEKIELKFEMTEQKKEDGIYENTGMITLKSEGYKFNVAINEKVDYKSEISVEDLKDENSFNLNNENETKIQSMVKEIAERLQKILPDKLKILEIDEEEMAGLFSNNDSSNVVQQYPDEQNMEFQSKYMEILNEYESGNITEEERDQRLEQLVNEYTDSSSSESGNSEETEMNGSQMDIDDTAYEF